MNAREQVQRFLQGGGEVVAPGPRRQAPQVVERRGRVGQRQLPHDGADVHRVALPIDLVVLVAEERDPEVAGRRAVEAHDGLAGERQAPAHRRLVAGQLDRADQVHVARSALGQARRYLLVHPASSPTIASP